MNEHQNAKSKLSCVRCRRSKTRCDNGPDPCTRCINAKVECIRRPRTEAERAKIREKRQLPTIELEMLEDSSEDGISTWSEGQQDLDNSLDHIDLCEDRSELRSISPPPIQREPARQFGQELYTTLGSTIAKNRENIGPDTTSHSRRLAMSPKTHQRVPSHSLTEAGSRSYTSTPRDAHWPHETSNEPSAFSPATDHQMNNMVNTTLKSSEPSLQKSPGGSQRPLFDYWGAQKSRPPFGNLKRDHSGLGYTTQEDHSKRPRVDTAQVETSLPLDIRRNTMLAVSLNGDKPGRAKQRRLGDFRNISALFAEVTRGWQDDGVDEEDCYIEVTYGWKQTADKGQVAYLERDQESGLEGLYHEIRENPCWACDADAWCIIDMKICRKY